MTLKRPKAILFDLDGTLVDTAPDFYDVVNGLRQEAGKAPLTDASIREQVSNGGAALTRLTWDIDDSQTGFSGYRTRLLTRYSDHIGSASTLFAGFADALNWLDQEQILWGIVTNKPRLYTEPLLQRLNIQAAVVICPEDVSHAKPHPEPLLKAATYLGLQATDCWYIGDHPRDITAARAAGMASVAATFGYIVSGDDPATWQADLQISQPQDLILLLQARS